jgi:hypothetical protein
MNIFNSTSIINNFLENNDDFFYESIITIDENIESLYENYIYDSQNNNKKNMETIKNIIKTLNKKKIFLIKQHDQKYKNKLITISEDITKSIENVDKLQTKINQHYIKIINDLQNKIDKKNLIIKQKIDEIQEMYFYDLY